jgi:hypothetical protein
MPLYYFNLQDGAAGIADPDGTDLVDPAAAMVHAHEVVLELMAHVEARTRHWLLDICDDSGMHLFEVPFVGIDRTIDHLEPQTRHLIEEACVKRRELASAIFDARANIRRARILVARSRRTPHLVTDRGRQI